MTREIWKTAVCTAALIAMRPEVSFGQASNGGTVYNGSTYASGTGSQAGTPSAVPLLALATAPWPNAEA